MEHSFTAHMPLLTTVGASGLGRRCQSSPQQCYLHCLCISLSISIRILAYPDMDMLINLTKISKLDTKHVSVIIQPSKKLVTTSLQNDAALSFRALILLAG